MVGLKVLPIQRYEREGRRRLGAEWEDALYPGLGTHYAYLEVGSPDAQRVSVIIDTGSSFTAFPCTGCSNCGTHTDAMFDPEASSSFEWLTCDKCKGGATCTSSGRCQASQSYAEGSTWQAQLALDRVSIDGALLEGFVFGCITSEDGLFVSQIADGIMGMSAHSPVASQLVMQGLTTSRAFSLCFAKEGGTMVLGGADEARRDGPMQFTSLLHSVRSWYTVALLDVEINGVSIGSSADVYGEGMGTIIDSGTTDTYLPHKVASAFESTWRQTTGFSFDSAHYVEQPNFPTLTFVFQDGLRVDVEPSAYVEQDSQRRKVPRLYFTQQSGAVLGASFMQNHDVLFDLDNNRIGIAPSSRCVAATEVIPSSMPTPMPTSMHTKAPSGPPISNSANKKKSGAHNGAIAYDVTAAAAAALIACLLLIWLTFRHRRRLAGPQFARLPTDVSQTSADSTNVDIQLGTPRPRKSLSWIWIVKQDYGVGQTAVQSPLATLEDDEKNGH